jgi:ribonuclease BN (tRNA processing enzyme)
MVITARSGKKMLIDCGGDVRFALEDSGIRVTELNAVYISHLHADHVGGMEWLALITYFGRGDSRLKLFGEENLLSKLWINSLKGGLECIGGKCLQLEDYFDCCPLVEAGPFYWESITGKMVKMPHVTGSLCQHFSYGLILETTGAPKKVVFISSDTVFQPEILEHISATADVIFHDCETTSMKTTVHAHYEQLRTLPAPTKQKIWLYHYQPDSGYDPLKDGFQGFVAKGQEFSFLETD